MTIHTSCHTIKLALFCLSVFSMFTLYHRINISSGHHIIWCSPDNCSKALGIVTLHASCHTNILALSCLSMFNVFTIVLTFQVLTTSSGAHLIILEKHVELRFCMQAATQIYLPSMSVFSMFTLYHRINVSGAHHIIWCSPDNCSKAHGIVTLVPHKYTCFVEPVSV